MPRSVDHTVSLDVPVDVLYQRFTTVDYWEDLVGFWKSCNLDTELRELSTDDSGTDVHFAHIMSAKDLPSIARKVVPGKFVVMREQHFDAFDASAERAGGRYTARLSAPVDISGQCSLSSTATGSQLQLTSSCRIKVPIIGGKLEPLLATAVKNLFTTEGNFTVEWIAGHS